MQQRSKPWVIVLVLAVAVIVVAAITKRDRLRTWWRGPTTLPQQVAKPHLDWAEAESEKAIDEHLDSLTAFFDEAKKNTPAFAERILGTRSKWLLVKDRLPFTEGKEHERFIRETFHEFLFKPEDLKARVKQVVSDYLIRVRGIEGKMLVNLRLDVADLPSMGPLATAEPGKLEALFDEAVARAVTAVGSDLKADVTAEIASVIVSEVLTQVAVRLGVSGGILATGAASSWATFGIGLVVGLIVDQIVSWVWDWWSDPKGELAAQLNHKLDELRHLILDGSKPGEGLGERLRQFARQRAVVRGAAVLDLLRQPTGGNQ